MFRDHYCCIRLSNEEFFRNQLKLSNVFVVDCLLDIILRKNMFVYLVFEKVSTSCYWFVCVYSQFVILYIIF